MAENITTVHGVFLQIFSYGVLITGASGIGKSELALELVKREHKFIADDCVEFYNTNNGDIIGKAPTLLQNFIEVRGIGIINMMKMFGAKQVLDKSKLNLVLHLAMPEDVKISLENAHLRLTGFKSSVKILESQVPKISIPVAAGRNLSILAEVAVQQQIIEAGGYDAAADFMQQQQQSSNKHFKS